MADDLDRQKALYEAAKESTKLFYDWFKHITTLSTGTIVVLATFLEKVFSHPAWHVLIIITFIGLIISVICALMAMFFLAKHLRDPLTDKEGDYVVAAIITCLACFLLAMLSLTVFTTKNFMT